MRSHRECKTPLHMDSIESVDVCSFSAPLILFKQKTRTRTTITTYILSRCGIFHLFSLSPSHALTLSVCLHFHPFARSYNRATSKLSENGTSNESNKTIKGPKQNRTRIKKTPSKLKSVQRQEETVCIHTYTVYIMYIYLYLPWLKSA